MSMDLVISGTNRAEIIPIEWLEVETHKGNLVIQEGHAPAYIVLKKIELCSMVTRNRRS